MITKIRDFLKDVVEHVAYNFSTGLVYAVIRDTAKKFFTWIGRLWKKAANSITIFLNRRDKNKPLVRRLLKIHLWIEKRRENFAKWIGENMKDGYDKGKPVASPLK